MSAWVERLAKRRIAVAYLYVPVFFWLARPTAVSLGLGSVPALIGLGLRLWASGYLRKGEVLATGGPYRFCRNPLYLGSFLLLLSFAIGSANWWLLWLSPPLFLLFYLPTMWREEAELEQRFGAAYRDYKSRVPRWVPGWPKQSGPSPGWSWERVRRHREPATTAIALIAYLLLILKGWLLPLFS